MIGWLVWGAVYLTRAIEYTIQAGRTRRTLFEWLFPLLGLEPLNPALTTVSSVLSPLMRHLCLLRRDLLLPSLVSEVPWFFDMLLLRAIQLSSPAQKRVMSVVRAAIDLGFS